VQATSRDRLLEAARRSLGEKGYDAATVREISTEAGVPQGLVHYYFGGKEGLLAEVLRQAALEHSHERRGQDPPAAARHALESRRSRVERDPAWYRMRYELFALGLRSPALAEPLRSLLAFGRDEIRALLAAQPGRDAGSAEPLAAIALACLDGLALQKLADPEFDLDAAWSVLEDLLEVKR
jgi:AcrR family transcriptional regulator